jgi:hypothetical protein
VDGPDDLINLEVWYWSTQDERENVYCWIIRCRSFIISNWASDRSCSLWVPDISLMEPLDHDEYACWRSISDVTKVQTERASGSRLNWRRKMDLDTFGIWVLFRAFGY